MPLPKAKDYLWAELGSLLGAVLAAPLAAGVLVGWVRVFHGESLEDLGQAVLTGFTIGMLVLMVGGSIGCWFALRRVGHPAPRKVGGLLFVLLVVTYLAVVASTGPFSNWQYEDAPAKFLPPGTVVPLAMPLLATWITGWVTRSVGIQTMVVLLVGAAVYGAFSRSSVVLIPVPVETPMVEEQAAVVGEFPLGSENPCWAGSYPDDLGFLESEEIPVRVFLVDLVGNDIYYSDCVQRELSEGANWPPGVTERLVRSSDLPDPEVKQVTPR